MRVVAIGNDRLDDGEGNRLEPEALLRDVGVDELVLVCDAGSSVLTAAVEDLAEHVGAGVDLVVGAWTYVDEAHGVVQRRGVFSPERLRWSNTAGPAFLVSGRALQRSGWGSDACATVPDLLLRLTELDPTTLVVESHPTVLAHVDDVTAISHGLVGAVERHLARVGIDAAVSAGAGPEPTVVVDRVVSDDLTVSVVVPTTGALTDLRGRPGRLVVNLLESLFEITDFPRQRLDVVLVIGPEVDPDLGDIIADRFGARRTDRLDGRAVLALPADEPWRPRQLR